MYESSAYDTSDTFPQPARTALTNFLQECLHREERLVITLYYADNLSMEEIAVVLDLPVTRVRDMYDDILTRAASHLGREASPVITAA